MKIIADKGHTKIGFPTHPFMGAIRRCAWTKCGTKPINRDTGDNRVTHKSVNCKTASQQKT